MRRLWPARFSAGLAFLAASGGALSFARADLPLNARFVEMLSRTGQKRHPLADASGKLPVVVQLPAGKTAREAGFQPFAPGLGVVKVSPAALGAFEAGHAGLGYSIWPPLSCGARSVRDLEPHPRVPSETRARRGPPPRGSVKG